MVLGVDVGGTKVQCVIADDAGNILAEGFGGGGNYQVCGEAQAYEQLRIAVTQALKLTGLQMNDISYAALGISGADEPSDFAVLTPLVKKLLGEVPFTIVNDSWIGLRAGTTDGIGLVSICGTGAGHAGKNKQGETLTLRNLDYITGNYGGGGTLVEEALHYAFRSEEDTWKKSALETKVPEIFGVSDMRGVCDALRKNEMTDAQRYQLPITVFTLAGEGDVVCIDLLQHMGAQEGHYAAAVVRRLRMCEEKVPAVLIGSLFKTGAPLLVDAYMDALHEAAPQAYPVILKDAPVVGAVKLALDHLRD